MNKRKMIVLMLGLLISMFQTANAGGKQDSNDCRTNLGNFCERAGSCAIQGSAWYQYVTIDKSDRFDTQGWPGLCDMVHVALVQGRCSPLGSQENVIANLSESTYAEIPGISGALACGGESDTGGTDSNEEICNDGIDNDGNGKTDCADKRACRKDSFCR